MKKSNQLKYFNRDDLALAFRARFYEQRFMPKRQRDFDLLWKGWETLLEEYRLGRLITKDSLKWEIPSWAKEKK